MDKRAQGLSINVIIIVAIALIVLVVLIAVFTGRMGSFIGGVDTAQSCSSSCQAFGGAMGPASDVGSCNGRYVPGKFSDVTSGVCCCT